MMGRLHGKWNRLLLGAATSIVALAAVGREPLDAQTVPASPSMEMTAAEHISDMTIQLSGQVSRQVPGDFGRAPSAKPLPPPIVPLEVPALPDEPMAASLDAQKAAAYLDTIAINWTHQRRCGTCHTNYAYVMARPYLPQPGLGTTYEVQVRDFFEERVRDRTSTPVLPHTLILGAVLAINDSGRGARLSAATREALDQAWELQDGDGGWTYPEMFYSPPLGDPWYGAAMVALGTGLAPDGYAATPRARAGTRLLRAWFARHPAPSLHHKLILLWADRHMPGLMTPAERSTVIGQVLKQQRSDGGWALPTLGEWNRRDGTSNDLDAPSDGYATGLVTFVLQDSGLTTADRQVAGGIQWLRTHQRRSGRWFTQSINTYAKGNLISNIGTAYAVMSLRRAGEI